jgi:hypothetical protein
MSQQFECGDMVFLFVASYKAFSGFNKNLWLQGIG